MAAVLRRRWRERDLAAPLTHVLRIAVVDRSALKALGEKPGVAGERGKGQVHGLGVSDFRDELGDGCRERKVFEPTAATRYGRRFAGRIQRF
jgi:hypothetical protein